jgi:hypothetical protein
VGDDSAGLPHGLTHYGGAGDYDAEIEGLRHIRFDVEIGGLTVEQYADLHWYWSGELFKVCPATHVCSFGLSLEIKDA